MRIVYVLLSPTFGMHQYTGDLAAQMCCSGHEVHVVTTTAVQRDRYPDSAALHTPVRQNSTGFTLDGLRGHELERVRRCILALRPDIVHFGGVHLWNPALGAALHHSGLTVVHTLHDLDPHPDVANGSLIRLWNRGVNASADAIVVHGECYRERLLAAGRSPQSVLATPLLHSFLAADEHSQLDQNPPAATFEPWTLFFGRFERYKGINVLLTAQKLLQDQGVAHELVLAGGGDLGAVWSDPLPPGVTLRNRRIDSAEGSHLFERCAIVVLPYTGATQSALPATAYAFGKPVLVTTSGALPEAVHPGRTGWVVQAGDAQALADCLAAALRDPDTLVKMGKAGRCWYHDERIRQRQELTAFYTSLHTRRSAK